ncbi:hypothetical protein O6H91_Y052900 [Diphasiastrum complanatum]|nr:hypothetical protein O6H91_Y052900 [Diphasiastrum complanatum]
MDAFYGEERRRQGKKKRSFSFYVEEEECRGCVCKNCVSMKVITEHSTPLISVGNEAQYVNRLTIMGWRHVPQPGQSTATSAFNLECLSRILLKNTLTMASVHTMQD